MSAVILDRDGVINFDSDEYIKSPEEWQAIPGSLAAISLLNRAGYQVYVATNQSGIARGFYDAMTLHAIHDKLHAELAAHGGEIADIFFCPHHPKDLCVCRKPNPGLLYDIRDQYQLNLSATFFIGDAASDIKAALTAGCKPILVLTGKGLRTRTQHPEYASIPTFNDLMSAATYVISSRKT